VAVFFSRKNRFHEYFFLIFRVKNFTGKFFLSEICRIDTIATPIVAKIASIFFQFIFFKTILRFYHIFAENSRKNLKKNSEFLKSRGVLPKKHA